MFSGIASLILLRPQLNGFRNMGRENDVAACKIRDGAGHLQDPVIAAGTERQFAEGVFHEGAARFVQFAKAFYLPVIHGCVAEDTVSF